MPEWLFHALRYIEQWLAFQMRLSGEPGCVIAVSQGQDVLLERAFGSADLAHGAPLSPRHRFRVASHSKTFTAAGIMLLVEQGRMRLDDPVGLHVAGLPDALAAAKLGQLLSHTSGLMRDGTDTGHWDDLKPFLDEAALRRELERPLVLSPSERLKYSNLGYGLLGLAIASVTGETFDGWIAREVVGKAGLTETAPDLPATAGEPLAAGHTGNLPVGRVVIPGRNPTRAMAAATGFVATAADLVRFFAQLDPAAPRSILSAASRREMTRRHWKSPQSEADRYYGLGTISGDSNGHEVFGHSGGFQGFQSRTCVVPDWGVTVSVIVNAVDGPAGDWMDGVLHILARFAKAGPPNAAVAGWTGRWWNLWGAVDLVPMGDTVLLAAPESLTPFSDASEVSVLSPDIGRIARANGFGSYGEAAGRTLDAHGSPLAIRLAGEKFLPEAEFVRRRTVAA